MPCQNITPVTVLPNFDGLPCQGTERFMSPICLVLQTGGWVRPRDGGAPLATPTHTITDPFPRYLFTRMEYVFVWHIALSSHWFDEWKVGRGCRQQVWGQSSTGRRKGGQNDQDAKGAMRNQGFCCVYGHWHGSAGRFHMLNVHHYLYCILKKIYAARKLLPAYLLRLAKLCC